MLTADNMLSKGITRIYFQSKFLPRVYDTIVTPKIATCADVERMAGTVIDSAFIVRHDNIRQNILTAMSNTNVTLLDPAISRLKKNN